MVLSGLHVDSSSDLARETAYKLYYQHDERQEELLTALLGRRALLARCETVFISFGTFFHKNITILNI